MLHRIACPSPQNFQPISIGQGEDGDGDGDGVAHAEGWVSTVGAVGYPTIIIVERPKRAWGREERPVLFSCNGILTARGDDDRWTRYL